MSHTICPRHPAGTTFPFPPKPNEDTNTHTSGSGRALVKLATRACGFNPQTFYAPQCRQVFSSQQVSPASASDLHPSLGQKQNLRRIINKVRKSLYPNGTGWEGTLFYMILFWAQQLAGKAVSNIILYGSSISFTHWLLPHSYSWMSRRLRRLFGSLPPFSIPGLLPNRGQSVFDHTLPFLLVLRCIPKPFLSHLLPSLLRRFSCFLLRCSLEISSQLVRLHRWGVGEKKKWFDPHYLSTSFGSAAWAASWLTSRCTASRPMISRY